MKVLLPQLDRAFACLRQADELRVEGRETAQIWKPQRVEHVSGFHATIWVVKTLLEVLVAYHGRHFDAFIGVSLDKVDEVIKGLVLYCSLDVSNLSCMYLFICITQEPIGVDHQLVFETLLPFVEGGFDTIGESKRVWVLQRVFL